VCLEHELQRTPLAVERGEQLGTTVGRQQGTVDESLERLVLADIGVRRGHARLEVPACAVIVTESRAPIAGNVLGARRAHSDITQQIRTRNEGHRVFL